MRLLLHSAALLAVPVSALLAQGPLSPTAAPAAQGKTLAQIEPRTDILTLLGSAGAVYVISQPGSYYLSASIPFQSKVAIFIQADNVAIDLNGFTVTGSPGVANGSNGIFASGVRKNVFVRNGFVVGWGAAGVNLSAVTGGEVRGVTATDSPGVGAAGTGVGLAVGAGFVVADCSARDNPSRGFIVGDGCTVANCVATSNGSNGFTSGASCTFTDCVARLNVSSGFELGDRASVRGCVATGTTAGGNTGAGFRALTGGVFLACSSSANAAEGYSVGEACILSYCVADSNGGANFLSGAACTLVGCNSSRSGGNGFFLGEGSHLVHSNAYLSNGIGVSVARGSVVRDSNVFSGKGTGIFAGAPHTMIVGNHSSLNGTAGSTFYGILSTGANNALEGNDAAGNIGFGLAVVGTTGNVVLRNTSRANTSAAFSIAAGNDAAPTGQAATATSPFANLQ